MNLFPRIMLMAALLLVALGSIVLAKPPPPGSEGDPIVTRSYVDWRAIWVEHTVKPGDFFKLPVGTELVVAGAANGTLPLREANFDRAMLMDLTAGRNAEGTSLAAGHHYLVGPGMEARITFDAEAVIMTRGLRPD